MPHAKFFRPVAIEAAQQSYSPRRRAQPTDKAPTVVKSRIVFMDNEYILKETP